MYCRSRYGVTGHIFTKNCDPSLSFFNIQNITSQINYCKQKKLHGNSIFWGSSIYHQMFARYVHLYIWHWHEMYMLEYCKYSIFWNDKYSHYSWLDMLHALTSRKCCLYRPLGTIFSNIHFNQVFCYKFFCTHGMLFLYHCAESS